LALDAGFASCMLRTPRLLCVCEALVSCFSWPLVAAALAGAFVAPAAAATAPAGIFILKDAETQQARAFLTMRPAGDAADVTLVCLAPCFQRGSLPLEKPDEAEYLGRWLAGSEIALRRHGGKDRPTAPPSVAGRLEPVDADHLKLSARLGTLTFERSSLLRFAYQAQPMGDVSLTLARRTRGLETYLHVGPGDVLDYFCNRPPAHVRLTPASYDGTLPGASVDKSVPVGLRAPVNLAVVFDGSDGRRWSLLIDVLRTPANDVSAKLSPAGEPPIRFDEDDENTVDYSACAPGGACDRALGLFALEASMPELGAKDPVSRLIYLPANAPVPAILTLADEKAISLDGKNAYSVDLSEDKTKLKLTRDGKTIAFTRETR
jgi:hypothetical protein